jgi:CheY-like chemotaxis protein
VGQARTTRLLIVDDEMLVAMLIEDMALELGYEVIGPAMTLPHALELANDTDIDCAILDVNLGNGVNSGPVAELLAQRGVPFLFATGYGAQGVAEHYRAAKILQKPFALHELKRALHQVVPPESEHC